MHLRQALPGLGRLGLFAALALFGLPRSADAYVDGGPATLGGLCTMSSHIMAVKIENFSEANRVGWANPMAKVAGDAIRGAWQPGKVAVHLQAARGTDCNAVRAADAMAFIEIR